MVVHFDCKYLVKKHEIEKEIIAIADQIIVWDILIAIANQIMFLLNVVPYLQSPWNFVAKDKLLGLLVKNSAWLRG